MRAIFRHPAMASGAFCLVLSCTAEAQTDPGGLYKANCALCHGADGSGNSTTGKALKAKDLRSAEIQKMSGAALADVITKGKEKMPPFEDKLQPDEIKKLVEYLKTLPKKK